MPRRRPSHSSPTRMARVRPGALVAMVLVVLCGAAGSAQAHTAISRATPGPGAEVASTVDAVTIEFLDPVDSVGLLSVADEDGSVVSGLSDPHLASPTEVGVSFDALAPGRYRVDIRFASADGDEQVDAYQFTVAATGSDDDAGPTAGIAVVAVVLFVVGYLGVRARRKSRSHLGDPRSE